MVSRLNARSMVLLAPVVAPVVASMVAISDSDGAARGTDGGGWLLAKVCSVARVPNVSWLGVTKDDAVVSSVCKMNAIDHIIYKAYKAFKAFK